MSELKSRKIRQYAPVKFGEPFNPNSVEGVQMRRRQAATIRRHKEEEAELAQFDANQAAERARFATRMITELNVRTTR